MWIFTKYGYFSVVATNKPDELMVRARLREHLVRLVKILDHPTEIPILETPQADYRFRIVTHRTLIAWWLQDEAKHINYGNFKNACHDSYPRDHDYHDALLDVWSAMNRLQWVCNPRRVLKPLMKPLMKGIRRRT